MTKRKKSKKDSSELAEFLRRDVIEALLNYEVWWAYRSPETTAKYAAVMDQYPALFNTAIGAHFVAIILPLFRIFDERSENLKDLMLRMQSEGVVSADRFNELDRKRISLEPRWKKIAILRNEVFGHRSANFSVQNSFTKAKISADFLREFIEELLILLNDVSSELSDSYNTYHLNSGAEAEAILAILKRAH